ncbi:mirror-image polydactyly gene 1 protein isoform X2 [Stigmatopora nigra]
MLIHVQRCAISVVQALRTRNYSRDILPVLTMYTKDLCPLCDEAKEALEPLKHKNPDTAKSARTPSKELSETGGHAYRYRNVEIGRTSQAQDEDKLVSLLLRELHTLRHINMKLLDQLSLKEEELQKKEVEMMGNTQEAKAWEKPSEFLGPVMRAHINHDEAMMSPVLLFNQRRDQAIRHITQQQKAAECDPTGITSFGDNDSEVDKLLQRVCDSTCAQEIAQLGSVLVRCVRSVAQRRRDITTQKVKAFKDERDLSLAKCWRLQQEVMEEREQRVNKEELLKLQREQDAAVNDRERLEAELPLLRAIHRPTPPPVDGQSLAPPLLS